jgi:hypothetical protein
LPLGHGLSRGGLQVNSQNFLGAVKAEEKNKQKCHQDERPWLATFIEGEFRISFEDTLGGRLFRPLNQKCRSSPSS